MKRKLTGLLALILAFGTTFGMTACGGAGATPNTENDLEIFYWNSGQGRVWLDNLIEAFEAKNPTVNVVKNFRETNDTWEKELPTTTENTIDLYINSMASMLAYTEYLEPLDDTLEDATDENGVRLIDKFDASMMNQLRKDGTLYGSYWGGGVCGLVYNKTVLQDLYANEWDKEFVLPRTTDELADLASDILDIKDGKGNSKYTPFIFPGNADYWMYCYLPWAAQYGGMDEINAYWNPEVVQEGGEKHVSKDAFITDARLEALKTLETVAGAEGFTYKASNAKTHTAVQTLFLDGTGLMMPNGSWVENEMRGTDDLQTEFEFMKLPIISSLGTKLGITDRVLAEVVSYVDSADYANSKDSGTLYFNDNSTEYQAFRIKDLPKATIDRVAEARNIVYTEGSSNKVAIPKYSNAKEWSKKFIQFMNTEEGLKYYWEEVKGPMIAKVTSTINTTGWTDFSKVALNMAQGATFVYRSKGSQFFYYNPTLEFYPTLPQTKMLAAEMKDRVSAEDWWRDECLAKYNSDWAQWETKSGLV